MMSLEVFLLGLLIVSTLTGLFTEAIKKWLDERGKKYYPNALAGYVAIGLSVAGWHCPILFWSELHLMHKQRYI